METIDVPALPSPSEFESRDGDPPGAGPQRLPADSGQPLLRVPPRRLPENTGPHPARPISPDDTAAPRRVDVSPRPVDPPRVIPLPEEVPLDDPGISPDPPAGSTGRRYKASPDYADQSQWSTLELLRQLHAADRAVADGAGRELRRRGFGALELQIGRRLADPDPAVRVELARTLPTLRGVDAGVWLLQLSKDDNADVRLESISRLATTSNPQVRRYLESISREDDDPRVRRLAEQIEVYRRR